MSYNPYHWCVVPKCKSTTVKTPGKLFIKVPNDIEMRNVWLELAKRDPNSLSRKSLLYICEDHFNLEHDMENYMEYKLMGSVKRIRMKPNTTPSRFDWFSSTKEMSLLCDTDSDVIKRQSISLIQENESTLAGNIDAGPSTSCKLDLPIVKTVSPEDKIKADKAVQVQVMPMKHHKIVQAKISAKYRSKATHMHFKIKDSATSPMKMSASIGTSPHMKITALDKPSTSGVIRPLKRKLSLMFEEVSDSEVSCTPSVAGSTNQDFLPSKATTSDSTLPEEFQEVDQKLNLQSTISKIKKKPRLYIGISKELYFLINIIQMATQISEENILLCLTKIRLNRTFSLLGDDFGLSLSQASKIFITKIPLISRVLTPFIKNFSAESIKLNLPIAFRHRYHKVTCIIDCLEIEIQKPTKAIHQALTWSDYKKANTIKYLIACTPDGLVSFISAGYGGRITDIALVEHCKFLDNLQPGTCILADRGFKHLEIYLSQKNITLMRPPSVASGTKLTKSDPRLTKQMASLRIHVERVIRRIREFSMLKLHSVININSISVLDECIVTACALINLQDSLINK